MENDPGSREKVAQPELRIVIIGGRWDGKSSTGNTILQNQRFECGRTRTHQPEVRHDEVDGRKLTVVDTPGWGSFLSLAEIAEKDKEMFKINVSNCPPGPNVFLLIIPLDCAFSEDHKRTVEEYMKLLGQRVWRYTMVLFTCGDYLEDKTIEQHIEREGDALKSIIERCNNRYHVFNNKKRNSSQVTTLLKKMDEMLRYNNGSYYQVEEETLNIIKEKQRGVAERAEKRQMMVMEQRQQAVLPEEMRTIQQLQLILLGSRGVGKTSVGNTIFGIHEFQEGKRTTHSVARKGFVGKTEITLVDTPGWWKGFLACDTIEKIKEEVKRSMFLCPPGPHVFLLVIDSDASFKENHLKAVTTHMELLGEDVWRHTMVVFTRGDWLGTNTIEHYIEGEGVAIQSLIELCGNRYHVLNNKSADNGPQVTELLEKITWTVAENNWEHYVPDEKIIQTIEEKRQRVEEGARVRQNKVFRRSVKGSRNKLHALTIAMLGEKSAGKSATGNNIVRKEVLPTCENKTCLVAKEEVADREITVIDTPGWTSRTTEKTDKEILRGLSMSPLGVHALLLVVPLDLSFREDQQIALEEQMNLFDASAWNHAMVLFTHGDNLADKSVEEYIEREHHSLRWLVDKCDNRYHMMNNLKKSDENQVTELLEKIEDMVAGNNGRLFCPNEDEVHQQIEEKFRRRKLKGMLKSRMEEGFRRRELELMLGFRETLYQLQTMRRSKSSKLLFPDMTKAKVKVIGQWKKEGKEKEETIDSKIEMEIGKLNKDIMVTTEHLARSNDFLLPDFKKDGPVQSVDESLMGRGISTRQFDNVLDWLSKLQISRNVENKLTLKFSETSGYASVLPHDDGGLFQAEGS